MLQITDDADDDPFGRAEIRDWFEWLESLREWEQLLRDYGGEG